MEIILIAAMAANRVIGKDNIIPWDIRGEQTRFKAVTMGHSLVMGRKTWESIGRPLPGRQNIVISRDTSFAAPGCQVAHSLKEGIKIAEAAEHAQLAKAKEEGHAKIFVIGGAQLYDQALPLADTLILTRLEQAFEGDAFFPYFSCPPFEMVENEKITGPVPYRIETYKRRQPQPSL